jgi:hypothetical protein
MSSDLKKLKRKLGQLSLEQSKSNASSDATEQTAGNEDQNLKEEPSPPNKKQCLSNIASGECENALANFEPTANFEPEICPKVPSDGMQKIDVDPGQYKDLKRHSVVFDTSPLGTHRGLNVSICYPSCEQCGGFGCQKQSKSQGVAKLVYH